MISIVRCPVCKIKVVWNTKNTYRPFCSKHCKKVDFNSWVEEKYAISMLENTPPSIDSF